MYPYIEGTYLTDTEIGAQSSMINPAAYATTHGGVSAYARAALTPLEYENFDPLSFQEMNPLIPEQNKEERGEFTKGVLRGTDALQGSLYGAAALTGDLLGIDAIRDFGIEGYERNIEEQQENAAAVESYKDIDSFSSLGKYIAGNAGAILPSAVGSLLGGGAGYVLGRTVAGKAIKSYAANTIKDRAASIIASQGMKGAATKQAQDAAIAAATKQVFNDIAAKVGTYTLAGTTAIQEAGANYGQDVTTHGTENTSPAQDLLFGIASGASEAILGADISLFKALTGKAVTKATEDSFRRELIKGLPKALAAEGGQEAFQEILSSVNANIQDAKGLLTTDDIEGIVNAAAAGAIGGGMFHVPTLVKSRANARNESYQTKELRDLITQAEEVKTKDEIEDITELTSDMILGAKSNEQTDAIFKAQQDFNTYWDNVQNTYLNTKRAGRTNREWMSLESYAQEMTPADQKSIALARAGYNKFQENKLRAEGALTKRLNALTRVGEIRNPLDDTYENSPLIPKDEQAYLDDQERQYYAKTKEWQDAHPWETAQDQASQQYKLWNNYATKERTRFNEEWDARNKQIIEQYNYWRNVKNTNGRLSPEQETQSASALAAYSKYLSDRKEAQKKLEQKLSKGYSAPDGSLITAAKLQANKDFQKQQVELGIDSGLYNNITDRLADTVTYTGKIQSVLDNRIRTIDDAIKSIENRLSTDKSNLALTRTAYDRYTKAIKDLQRNRMQTIRGKRKINKLMSNISKKSQSLSFDNMSDIGMDIQELYHTGDSILSLERADDVFTKDQFMTLDVAKDRFEKLKGELARVTKRIDNLQNPVFDQYKNTAKAMLSNTKAAFDNVNLERDFPLKETPVQTTNPAAEEAQTRRDQINDAVNQSVLERSYAITQQQALAEKSAELDAVNRGIQDNKIRMETGQQNVQIPSAETQSMEPTRSDMESAAASDVAFEREKSDFRNLATAILAGDSAQKDTLTKVTKDIQNTLNRLPGLKNNVIVAADGNDATIPVEIQNLFMQSSGSPKGAYWNGKVYLFASNITSKEDAVRTIVHEGVAHYGLRSIMNNEQLGRFLSLVFDSFAGTQTWKDFASRRPEYFKNNDKLTQAEEFVAYVAEQMKTSKLLRPDTQSVFTRVVSFLRGILSRLGFGDKLTVNDIRDVLTLSAQNLANKRSGVRESLKDVVVTDAKSIQTKQLKEEPIYGVMFPDAEDATVYYKRLEGSRSGIPNTPYIYNYPKNSNTLNLNDPLNVQSDRVQARMNKLFKSIGIKPSVEQNGNVFSINFLGRVIGEFPTPEEATKATRSEDILNNVTGWDLYNYLVSQTDSKRKATEILRQAGIRGAQYASTGLNRYYLFEGNDIGTVPFKYNLASLSEPKFLVDEATAPDDITIDQETGLPTTKDTGDQRTYMNTLFSNAEKGSKWARIYEEFKNTGKSRDINGNLINHGWTEKFLENGFDQYRRLKIVQDYLKNKYDNVINFTTNTYQNLQTLTGRIKDKQLRKIEEYYRPIVDVLKTVNTDMKFYDENGNVVQTISVKDKNYADAVMQALNYYLIARHASERNASVSARMRGRSYTDKNGVVHHYNAKTPEKGGDILNASGMPDSQAAMLISRYETVPGFKEAAQLVDKMNKYTLDNMLEYGLIDRDSYDKMSQYQYYVPLRGWEDMIDVFNPGTYKVHGSLSTGNKKIAQMAKGRTGLPESPLLRSVQQMEDIIAVGERNELMRGFGDLVRSTQNEKDLWEIDRKNPDAVRIQVMSDGNLGFVTKPTELSGSGDKAITYLDENGKQVRIVIKDPWLARALRGENKAVLNSTIDFLRRTTGLMAQFMTSRNPAFAITNPVRDLQSAILNLGNVIEENQKRGLMEEEKNLQMTITKEVVSGKYWNILKDISLADQHLGTFDASKFDSQMIQDLYDWRKNGGHTRSLDVYTVQDLAKQLRSELRKDGTTIALGKKALKYMDILADTTENMTRFSVYRNIQRAFERNINARAKAEGWAPDRINLEIEQAKQKSANIALDCTVNFTKKGAWANAYNPVWAFSSASLQSFYRIARNLWRPTSTPEQNFKRVGKFISFGIGFPFMWGTIARSIMGDDDDGINKYDKIPNYVKLSNLIIPMPFGDGGYIKIPLPYGYNVFHSLGIAVDNVAHKNTGVGGAAVDVLKTAISGVSPIDPTEGFTAFMPTILKPIAELATNKNFVGAPIVPEGFSVEHLPNYLKSWTKTPQNYKDIAAFMNYVTGGFMTKDGIGLADISPEVYEHLVNSYLGGLGRLVSQSMDLAGSTAFDYNVPAKSIPVLNRLYGVTSDYSTDNALYNTFNNQVKAAKAIEDLVQNDPAKLASVREDYANALAMKSIQNTTTQQLNQIRQAENALRKKYPAGNKSKAYSMQMELLEKRKQVIMKRFNSQARRLGLDTIE